MKADPGRFLSGWLTVEIRGEKPERLLDRALAAGLSLHDTRWLEPGRLLTKLILAELRQLAALARPAGCRLRVRRRQGLPFLLRSLRRRPLLPAAALLFLPLLAFLCSLVAEVEVTSPVPLDPREQVLVSELARSAGVRAGRSRWVMDLEAAEDAIRQGFPRLIYTEILCHGNRLEIAVVRRIDVAEEEQIRPPGDLVSAADGVIVDVLVQRGTAQVVPGQRVRPGQVLISGDFGGEYQGAAGIVTARVFGAGYGECPLEEIMPTLTGRSTQQVRLARTGADEGVKLLGRDSPYRQEQASRTRRQLCLWRKIPLPVEIILIEVAEVDPVRCRRTPEQARNVALRQARSRALAALSGQAGGRLLDGVRCTELPLELGDGLSRARVVVWATARIASFRPLSAEELRQWQDSRPREDRLPEEPAADLAATETDAAARL